MVTASVAITAVGVRLVLRAQQNARPLIMMIKPVYNLVTTVSSILKMGQPGPLFFSRFFKQTIFTKNQSEEMSIQYTAPGFDPTTSQI